MKSTKAYECYHCKQWVEAGEEHDCWTTTEAALTGDLSEDLQDAYERIRDAAVELGEQRVYASGSCIMFSRTSCYFFVRPKRQYLELAVFLPRSIKSPLIKKIEPKSKVKLAHMIRVTHRDEVEAPLTDWLKEAYDFEPLAKAAAKALKDRPAGRQTSKPAPGKKAAKKKPIRRAKKAQSRKRAPVRRR